MKPARIRTVRHYTIWDTFDPGQPPPTAYCLVYTFRNEPPYPTISPPVLPSNGEALRHGDLDRNEDEWWARPDVI